LPERGSVYSIAEDPVDRDLIFAGTEFGVFVSNRGGKSWKKLSAGLPTIAVKDMAIQPRENDLVLATFGRGFYVLDDYSSLRNTKDTTLNKEAILMPIRDAYSFENKYPLGLPGKAFQGDSYYHGDNLGPNALITYYIKDKVISAADTRTKAEEKAAKANKDNVYPTYEQLAKERDEEKSKIYITIKNQQGDIVRKLTLPADKSGLQRITWDLRTASKDPVHLGGSGFYNPFEGKEEGPLVSPGVYTVTLERWQDGKMKILDRPVLFRVKALGNYVLPPTDTANVAAFKRKVEEVNRVVQSASAAMREAYTELNHIRRAISVMEQPEEKWLDRVIRLENKLDTIQQKLSGDPLKAQLDMDPTPSIADRIGRIQGEYKYSSADPTGTHQQSLRIAQEDLSDLIIQLRAVLEVDFPQLRNDLQKAGAPYTPNAIPSFMGTKG
jgi:hypothetical protein